MKEKEGKKIIFKSDETFSNQTLKQKNLIFTKIMFSFLERQYRCQESGIRGDMNRKSHRLC